MARTNQADSMPSGSSRFPLAVDTMGGDLGPAEVVEAVKLALKAYPDLEDIVLVGAEDVLKPLLRQTGLSNDCRLSIEHAPDVVGMEEKPKESYRRKDTSMMRALSLVKEGRCRAVVSCGNTGSLMFAGYMMLRPMSGIERPSLATIIPSHNHHFLLTDSGANPESTARHLLHNAILGSRYAELVLPNKKPRVGLLTIGTEEGKGNARVAEAHEMLKTMGNHLHYVGPIEGFDTFKNVADVVVCDGFTGNIVLKSLESCFSTLKGFMVEELTANPLRKIGAFLSQGAFKAMKRQLSPENYAGAPLLGLKGLVLKAHGSSNRYFIRGAIRIARETLRHDMNEHLEREIAEVNKELEKTFPKNGGNHLREISGTNEKNAGL